MAISVKVTTPEAAKLRGYTKEVTLDGDVHTLNVLVKPDYDLDSQFNAFCLDESEMLSICGWHFVEVE